jgi:hypothetical protein
MKTPRFFCFITCWATLGLLISPISLTAQRESAEVPDMAAFVKAYRRANPWAPQPGRYYLYREAVPVNAASLQLGIADPLGYLYAHGYPQSLSGTQFYMAQKDIARQFAYGPLGNPYSIPHLSNLTYNLGGMFLTPGLSIWDTPGVWGLPVGIATTPFHTVRPRRDFTLPTEATGESTPPQERGTTAPDR